MYFVYLIQSEDNNRYIGLTKDVERRLKDHNTGKNKNASTKGKTWRLVYYEAYYAKEDAQERERKLKAHGNAKRYLYERAKHSLKIEKNE